MRVRMLKTAKGYWNYAVQEFKEGEEFFGDLARHLADNTPEGSVKVLEADPEPEPEPKTPVEPPETPDPDGDEPPVDGTIDDLMAWVNDDRERAGAALAAEQAKDKPRSTVVKRLTSMVDSEE